ncbi:MAG: hypothetical protein R3284_09520 [Rubricoccaceae bacterium]|nr:hypothetical protein [Rubricoccaceae bacterium]
MRCDDGIAPTLPRVTASTSTLRNLAKGEQRRPIEGGGSDALYVPTGHIVYGFGNTLRAVPFDLETLEVTGSPVRVLDGVVTTATGAPNFSFAANGTLVYAAGTLTGDLAFPVARLTPGGDEEICR